MVARSPNYPAIDLATALASIEAALKAENRNKMSRLVLAKHLGYNSLNGRALGKIGAVRAYGLIDGRGDELKVSEDAVTALMAPGGSPERRAALERLALQPALFKKLRSDFPDSLPSEENIKFQLVKGGFTGEAAGKAAKTYLKTMRLVSENPDSYNPSEEEDEDASMQGTPQSLSILDRSPASIQRPPMVQEKFDLDEGPVAFSVPSVLSPESYQDLADRMEIFLRGLKRRSDAEAKLKE